MKGKAVFILIALICAAGLLHLWRNTPDFWHNEAALMNGVVWAGALVTSVGGELWARL